MPLLNWTNALSVGIKEIDDQHQKLVEIINKLYDEMKAGKGKSVLGRLLIELSDYTLVHFSTEEKYFKKFGYPMSSSHIIEHQSFVSKVNNFRKDFESGRESITLDIMNFLSNWITTHIKGTDKKYTRFFQEKGLK